MTNLPRALPCPMCGSTDLVDGQWYLDDDEVDAIECNSCEAGALASVWNQRPSPWRYPDRGDPLPEDGQSVLAYINDASIPRVWKYIEGERYYKVRSWMPVPGAGGEE